MKPVLLFLAILFAAVPVSAAVTYTYQFTGTIDAIGQNQNNAIPGVYAGQTFSGWFSYNSDTLTTEIGALSFTLGSFQPAVIDDRLYLIIMNYTAPPVNPSTYDMLSAMYYDTQGEYAFWRTGIVLEDTTCTALSTTQLPTNLTLSMFTSARFDIIGIKGSDPFNISGAITGLSPIPEPATLLLLAGVTLCLRRNKSV
jgi:hypothetical protein